MANRQGNGHHMVDDSKYDMEDGKLQGIKEDIGNINNAAGWDP